MPIDFSTGHWSKLLLLPIFRRFGPDPLSYCRMFAQILLSIIMLCLIDTQTNIFEPRGGSVVECLTRDREFAG